MASTLDIIEEATYKQNDVNITVPLHLWSHRSDKSGRQHEAIHPAWQLEKQHVLDAGAAPRPVVRAARHAVDDVLGLAVLVLSLSLGRRVVHIPEDDPPQGISHRV